MHLCYVDESGDAEPLRTDLSDSPPVFVLVGMTVPQPALTDVTWDFIQLKKEFMPSLQAKAVRFSDLIEAELKGSKLRKDMRKDRGSRNVRRRALGILDKTLTILETHNCQLVGKIVVKEVDPVDPVPERTVYSRAIAEMATSFEAQLAAARTDGIMILDARTKVKNTPSVMGITTRRYKSGGNLLPHLVESPVFGHSDTHVPLQIVDIVASAILFPLACLQYCSDLDWNVHPHPRYREVKEKFGERVSRLEYRYNDAEGVRRGGFQAIDPLEQRPTHLMFRDPKGRTELP